MLVTYILRYILGHKVPKQWQVLCLHFLLSDSMNMYILSNVMNKDFINFQVMVHSIFLDAGAILFAKTTGSLNSNRFPRMEHKFLELI